jgi:DNA-binding MarR family transcriptional regulator
MDRQLLSDQLMHFAPMMMKKLFRDLHSEGISMHQIQLLSCVKKFDNQPMRFYGEKLMISKPNLSVLVGKLLCEGYLTRVSDGSDRRVMNLVLTGSGEKYIDEQRQGLRTRMMEKLAVLDDDEASRLLSAIEEMTLIINKL